MATNRVKAIEMYTFDSSSLTGGYDLFVPALDEACFLIRIINASNKNVAISLDGAVDNDLIVSGRSESYNFQTNNQPRGHLALMAKGQQIYLHGAAGTGFIYLAGYYV